MENKVDKALEAIFDWGGGTGGLLFMTFVMAPMVLFLVAGFIQGIALCLEVFGLA